MKVGPTVRIVLLSGAAAVESAGFAGGAGAATVAGGVPFLAETAFAGGRDIFFAPSSVTMMSPCCSPSALSSMFFRASDQVCPASLHEQDGSNSWR